MDAFEHPGNISAKVKRRGLEREGIRVLKPISLVFVEAEHGARRQRQTLIRVDEPVKLSRPINGQKIGTSQKSVVKRIIDGKEERRGVA